MTFNTAQKLILRIVRDNIIFVSTSQLNNLDNIEVETYIMKNGISTSANLRDAFKTISMLRDKSYSSVQLYIDAPVLMVPMEEYKLDDAQGLYTYMYNLNSSDKLEHCILPELSSVALFTVNKDIILVLKDRFNEVRISPLLSDLWQHLYNRNFVGHRCKLYTYIHDKKLELFSFNKGRFKYCNTFDAHSINDLLYYILSVWQHTGMDRKKDELYIMGDENIGIDVKREISKFIANAYNISPNVEFNRATVVSQIKELPYDIVVSLMK